MFPTRHQVCVALLALGVLAVPGAAPAQTLTPTQAPAPTPAAPAPSAAQGQGAPSAAQGGAPTPEAFRLYDNLVGPVTTRAGLAAAPAGETGAAACRRQAVVVEVMIRFAIAATLPPGTTFDNTRTENRREAVDLLVEDARGTLNRMAGTDATPELCAAAARGFGAGAFQFAQSINRANVQRNAQVLMPPPKPPGPPERTEEEIAAEEAAKAASDRLQAEKAEAERLAKEKVERAFANLRPFGPAGRNSRAQPLSFNIYVVDTPKTREVKNFKLCFDPGLYQRAAKPMVDLAAAVFEVPEAAFSIEEATAGFLAKLGPVLAKRMDFPADRLTLENTDGDPARGPIAEPVKAVATGCNLYVGARPPQVAHDDGTTTIGLLVADLLEDIVLRPALDARQAALTELERGFKQPPPAEGAAAPPAPRPDVLACTASARCRAGVRVAVNACLQVAERRNGKAAIARELEVRQRVTGLMKAKPDDDAIEKDFQLVSQNLELIDGTLSQTLDKLAKAGPGLRQQASALLTSQELDAAVTAGRNEGEQSMGTPMLQCQARLADGRAIGQTTTR